MWLTMSYRHDLQFQNLQSGLRLKMSLTMRNSIGTLLTFVRMKMTMPLWSFTTSMWLVPSWFIPLMISGSVTYLALKLVLTACTRIMVIQMMGKMSHPWPRSKLAELPNDAVLILLVVGNNTLHACSLCFVNCITILWSICFPVSHVLSTKECI